LTGWGPIPILHENAVWASDELGIAGKPSKREVAGMYIGLGTLLVIIILILLLN